MSEEPRVDERQQRDDATTGRASSFGKGLFMGELHEDLVFPYPTMADAERKRVGDLVDELRTWSTDHYDEHAIEAAGWIGDDTLAWLGEHGFMGLYVPEEYGGLGLSQTAYCRVSEEFGRIDGTLATVMGVHQSIGMKGIHLFGSDEQKERFLPPLARGEKLAAFALTEPTSGSDAYHLDTRAERQSDGSWVLNGEKRYIGEGNRDVVVCFARSEEHGHVALILEQGMDGFESPFRYETMGIKGNDLRHLTFNDVRVPAENVLGEPGDGFRIAMNVLNNGRMSLGTGSVGATKSLIDLVTRHVHEREQFGQPLADFELVQEKISWMTSYLYGLESMSYLTTGLVDTGVEDYSLESAMVKVSGTEFLWYAANRAFQLGGGEAYLAGSPYEKTLRDIRIFPIFEGANDVLRLFIALSGIKPLGEALGELSELDLRDPIGTIGVLAGYALHRVRRELRPTSLTQHHSALSELADPVADQVARLRDTSERLLRRHGRAIQDEQFQLKRLAHAAMDVYAQVATISRTSSVIAHRDVETTGTERYLAETFCERAASRVHAQLDRVESNDDDRMRVIARETFDDDGYGFALY